MSPVRIALGVVVGLCVGALSSPAAAVVLGGGAADRDCRVAYAGVEATDGASQVTCVDGAPCDQDGIADGACRVRVALCVGVEQAGCQGVALDRIDVAGVLLAAPTLPAPDGTCGEETLLEVPVGEAAAGTLLAWNGSELRDVDYLDVCCVPASDPLAAARCSVRVDPTASGCVDVPRGAERGFEAARERVAAIDDAPAKTRSFLRKAARKAAKVRKAGRRLAKRDPCGNALGLMGTHARDTLRAAR